MLTEEAAKTLGTDKDFMNKLVDWCNVEEHAGVKGELKALWQNTDISP